MPLDNKPRPLNDNRIGLHGVASTGIFETRDHPWSTVLRPLLEAMDIRWFLFLTAGTSNLPLAKRLVDMGIMPICRFYFNQQYPDYQIDPVAIREFVKVGVPYFVFANEPDSPKVEWSKPMPHNWLEIVVDTFIRDAQICIGEGGIPLFPAFSFGSDTKRPNVAQMIVDRAGAFAPTLIHEMCWTTHNYGLGKPILYPDDPVTKTGEQITQEEYESYGQPWVGPEFSWGGVSREEVNRQRAAMPEVRDGTDNILKNPTCFRNYEYFNHLIFEATGEKMPIFGTEMGWHFHSGIQDDDRWPFLTPWEASEITLDAFKYTQVEGPDYHFADFYWNFGHNVFGLGAGPYEFQGTLLTTQFEEFGVKNNLYPLVQMLIEQKPFNISRANGPLPETWPYYNHPWRDGFDLNIRYTNPPMILNPVLDTSVPYWKLQEVKWKKEGKGRGYIRCVVEGKFIEGMHIVSRWNGSEARSQTKGVTDGFYGDVPVPAISTLSVLGVAVESDELTNVFEGEVHCTFELVEGENRLMFDHLAKEQEMLAATEPLITDGYELAIEEKVKTKPGIYWACKGIYHLKPEENNGNHHVYLGIFDEKAVPIKHALVQWNWLHNSGEPPDFIICDKPYPIEPMGNLPVAGNMEAVELSMGPNSDRAYNIRTGHEDEGIGNTWGHHSFFIVFQKIIVSETPPSPPPPPPPPPPAPGGALALLVHVQNVLAQLKGNVDDFLSEDVTLDELRLAIGKYESGLDYKAQNPHTTASGAYQYVRGTWANYGNVLNARDASPEVQDRRMLEDLMARKIKYRGDIEQMIAHHYFPLWTSDKSKWDTPVPVEGGIPLRQYVNGVLKKL